MPSLWCMKAYWWYHAITFTETKCSYKAQIHTRTKYVNPQSPQMYALFVFEERRGVFLYVYIVSGHQGYS